MTCGKCVAHVEKALRGLAGVTSVEVTLASGEVAVTHDSDAAPLTALLSAIEDEGYTATPRPS